MNFLSKLLQAIGFIPGIVTTVEGLLGHSTGEQKKDAVMSFLQAALGTTDALMSREIVDQDGFKKGLSEVVDGVVTCFNASVWAKTTPPQSVA